MSTKFFFVLLVVSLSLSSSAQAPVFSIATGQSETILQNPTDCDPLPLLFSAKAISLCTKSSKLRYSWAVDFDHNGTTDLTGGSKDVILTKANGLKFGWHYITWRVVDACGRSSTIRKKLILLNAAKPTPVTEVVSLESLQGHVGVTLIASQVNKKSYDNCTPAEKLRFRLAKSGSYSSNLTLAEVLALNDYVVFDGCKEQGVNMIALFVIDSDNNWAYRETTVDIRPKYNCDSINRIFVGNISTVDRRAVRNVRLFYNGVLKDSTDFLGNYKLNPTANLITIKPAFVEDIRSGLTSADLVELNKLLVGKASAQTPYQKIAADINGDKKVDSLDYNLLKELILYDIPSGSISKIWRFVPKTYVFTMDTFNFPEFIVLDTLDKKASVDFYGIKVGDVNGSAKPNGLIESINRGSSPLSFMLSNQLLVANQPFTLHLPISELLLKDGFQFAIKIDPARATCLSVDGIDSDSYHFDPLTGELLVAFVKGLSTGKDISLQILPKANGRLQDMLTFPTDKLTAEFYFNGEEKRFAFGFDQVEAAHFAAFPNPFSNSTTLKLFASKAEMIEYKLYEASGRLVWSRMFPAVAGWNEVHLDANELPGGGTYYIQAKMEQGVLTEKLIYLR